jgi:integrase
MAVLIFTVLRRGDAVRLGRQHERDGEFVIIPDKTRRNGKMPVRVTIPILPPLRQGPVGEVTYICGANGRPLTKESFGNDFRDAARAAGVNKSAHGLRKIAATRMAENGASASELNAVFGWVGLRMASLYTQGADRARPSRRADTRC